MSVTSTNRRERVRHDDGTRTDLPGAAPATGLSAIAACALGVESLSGAARAAVYHDAMIPHAEVTIGVESLADVPTGEATIVSYTPEGGYTVVMSPPGMGGLADVTSRRDNTDFGVFLLDVATLDDDRFELGPRALPDDSAAHAKLPYVWRPTVALERLVANPYATPTDPLWSTTNVPSDENMVRNPSFTTTVDYALAIGGTVAQVASGGVDAGPFLRLTKTGAAGTQHVTVLTAAAVYAGDRVSARAAVKGTAGAVVRLRLEGMDAYAPTSATVTLSGSWQTLTLDGGTVPAGVEGGIVKVTVQATTSMAVGATVDVDQVKMRRAATAGSYIDGTTAGAAWYGNANASPSYVQTSTGVYSRVSDPLAPGPLGPGDLGVSHVRTGALAAGVRLSAPAGRSRYALHRGRTMTVAGWVACKLTSGVLPPMLRWVVDILHTDVDTEVTQVLGTLRSDPFAPPPDGVWRRAAMPLVLPDDESFASAWSQPFTQRVRVHLEVVDPRSATTAGVTLSTRGVHMYAGPDRGDTEGLRAVPLLVRLAALVNIDAAHTYTVNRVDVHGVDRIGGPTAVGVRVLPADGESPAAYYSGESVGRITARGEPIAQCDEVWAVIEETNAGPGTPDIALMTVDAWHELDATADLESLTIDRSADADPSSSTVPIGNYAATAVTVSLDDPDGAYALWARSYLELGHRVDTAAGVVYTNRSQDPQAVDAAAVGAAGTATWPPLITGTPVQPVTADVYGQVPPAAFAGSAEGSVIYDAPMSTTAPVGEGWTVRARAWVRWTTPLPPNLAYGGARQFPTSSGWSVGLAAGATTVVPTLAAGVWWLVDFGEVVIPFGMNVAAITAQAQSTGPGVIEVAAPTFERYIGGEVVEVVETAPAGVFYTTGWDATAPRGAVTVQGVDILAAAGDGDLPSTIVRNTTVEGQLAVIARRYLDLGDDQVVIAAQTTPLPYAFPVEKVSTQLADLAKAGVLTAFTDGLGRMVTLPRVDVSPEPDAQALDDRSLVAASAALTPDIVRNDVRVTVHPVTPSAAFVTLGVVGRDPLPVVPFVWEPTDADIPVAPGATVEVLVDHDPADEEAWAYYIVPPTYVPGDTVTAFQVTSTPTVTATVEAYPTFVRVRVTNHPSSLRPAYLVRFAGQGKPLVVANTTQRYVRDASVQAFGRRPIEVDVRLAQSPSMAQAVGSDVLENYSLRDDTGERWLPDLNIETLGDPWSTIGDRVLVRDAAAGLSGEFRVVTHRYEHEVGATSGMYLRRVPTGLAWFVLDSSALDDAQVLS